MFSLRRKKKDTLTLHTETTLTYSKEISDELYIPPSNYKATPRRLKLAHLDNDHGHIMNANVQTPAAGQKAQRYTGFNEPFNHDRNTTLPHPDADTSPNATIEAPDFNLARTQSKSSFRYGKSPNGHSFRNPLNKNKHSAGATSVGSDLSSMYDNIQYADGSVETKDKMEIEKEAEAREDIVRAPGLIPGMMGGQKKKERLPNDSGVDMRMDDGEGESSEGSKPEKKRGVLGKFGL